MKQKQFPYDNMLILLGTISIFLCYLHAFPSAINIPLFFIMAVLFYVLIQVLVSKDQQNIIAGAVLIMFVILFLIRSSFMTGIQNLYNQMVDVYAASDHYVFDTYLLDEGTNYSLQSTLCILTVFICYVLVLSTTIRHHRGYFLDFLLSLSLFIPTFMYRVPQSFLIDALLFSFWVLLFISYTLMKTGAIQFMGKAAIRQLIIVVFVMTYGLLCVSPPFVYQENEWIETTRLRIQTFYRNLIQGAVADKTGEVDLRNAGDRYYLGTEEMRVKASKIKDYYIKTFSAAIYHNQKWNMLDEYVYDQENIVWGDVYDWFSYTHSIRQNQVERAAIDIEDKRSIQNYAPVPYDLASASGDFSHYYDAYVNGDESSTYSYEQWQYPEEPAVDFTPFRKYMNFAQRRYMDVPDNISKLFDELSFATPSESYTPKEATAIIQAYLNEHTIYTLHPGTTPKDQDFVYYFLTENKQGYCVHYATSATLMFRYMGIPARYVEGFHISETSFNKNGVASVSDRQAHAWVEILDEERGWIPVEVTASAESSETPQRPNQTGDENTPNAGDDTNTPDTGDEKPAQDTPNSKEPIQKTQHELDLHLDIVLPVAGVILAGILVLWIHQRRYGTWMRRMKLKNRKKALIHCEAYLQQWKPYGVELSETQQQILEKAIYSRHEMSEEEYRKVYLHLIKQVETCFKSLPIRKKLYVIFFKAIK